MFVWWYEIEYLFVSSAFRLGVGINSTHVYHPINSYHLVKRTFKYLPMILNDMQIHNIFHNMSREVVSRQLANGLYQIEEYSYSTPSDMINGVIQATQMSKKHVANKKLSLDDVISISESAQSFNNYDKQIAWLESGIRIAKTKSDRYRIR